MLIGTPAYLAIWVLCADTCRNDKVARKRNIPEDKPKEIKYLRSGRRACHLGDSKSYDSLCTNPGCRLCVAIKSGFRHLDFQQQQVNHGIRFGGGIYLTASSNDVFEYANDLRKDSEYLAVIATRTVLGNIQFLSAEDHTRMTPDKGFDSGAKHFKVILSVFNLETRG
ncbi:hypothetical protein EDD18DRAFT_1285958 [Armillaria luteobubalina]|uniref:PARP catalytic domain-containing protein n=1 Tax=Armillaria luteobubalina TaxID=153913 RepID=A0AA39Q5S6_9AGAR|nr:hypothetical protein EDD18DRAFT_1285958 [Armillaria luteobubalina]